LMRQRLILDEGSPLLSQEGTTFGSFHLVSQPWGATYQ
jgi:hypothetical protein